MRFWGWGEDAHAGEGLPPHAEAMLARELDLPPSGRRGRVRSTTSGCPTRRSPTEALAEPARRRRGARRPRGAGPARRREGVPGPAPHADGDARRGAGRRRVPASHDEVRAVLDVCGTARASPSCRSAAGRASSAASSRSGPTSPALVALDLGRLDRRGVGRRALADRGDRGRAAASGRRDDQLGEHGLTLGHFPQSFEYATVGGCVATRSAGQASTGYGRIDELVLGRADGRAGRRRRRCRRCPRARRGRTCAS